MRGEVSKIEYSLSEKKRLTEALTLKAMEMNFGRNPTAMGGTTESQTKQTDQYIKDVLAFYQGVQTAFK